MTIKYPLEAFEALALTMDSEDCYTAAQWWESLGLKKEADEIKSTGLKEGMRINVHYGGYLMRGRSCGTHHLQARRIVKTHPTTGKFCVSMLKALYEVYGDPDEGFYVYVH